MRNYALIVLGLNTVLRISDILLLTWNDVYDFEEKTFKTHVYIKEKKTGKDKKFLLNKNATEGLLKHKRKLGHKLIGTSRSREDFTLLTAIAGCSRFSVCLLCIIAHGIPACKT
ncbi:tyrosine-type recombinase/integrase [Clostridium pasteurianum]|uniref:tyrosine-type recombinase/integrase n=1 Tax=Clostridium pasteurianum TaxID=1501 RepID=UPI001FA852D1|nr:tyrosine-type recombinase/integrase [Clostridium pasteurianum]